MLTTVLQGPLEQAAAPSAREPEVPDASYVAASVTVRRGVSRWTGRPCGGSGRLVAGSAPIWLVSSTIAVRCAARISPQGPFGAAATTSRRGAAGSTPHSSATAALDAARSRPVLRGARGRTCSTSRLACEDPAGAAGGEQELLLLELERQQFEQFTLAPEDGGQVVHAHGSSRYGFGVGDVRVVPVPPSGGHRRLSVRRGATSRGFRTARRSGPGDRARPPPYPRTGPRSGDTSAGGSGADVRRSADRSGPSSPRMGTFPASPGTSPADTFEPHRGGHPAPRRRDAERTAEDPGGSSTTAPASPRAGVRRATDGSVRGRPGEHTWTATHATR